MILHVGQLLGEENMLGKIKASSAAVVIWASLFSSGAEPRR
jgi:hypothetical protein